jgi:hypothetical protein
MQEVALTREVVPDEQASFANMLENTSKAFPALSRKQAMRLVLDALKSKHKRQLPATEDDAGSFAEQEDQSGPQAAEQSDRESLEEDTRQLRSTLLCKSLGAGPITVCEKQKDIGGDDRRAADVNP